MNYTEALQKVEQILTFVLDEVFENGFLEVGYGSPSSWASLANFAILTAVEDEFGVEFTTEELGSIRTVRMLLARLEELSVIVK